MIGSDSAREVVICANCGADEMGCQVKAGLCGRRCCAGCDHDLVRRDGDHHDQDHVVHRDHDAEDHPPTTGEES